MDTPNFWNSLLAACALVLVVEGLFPFVSPSSWRAAFERACKLSDGQLRFVGLGSLLIGLSLSLLIWL